MNKKPLFSVVVPVYNKEPHISRAINSILNQSFTDFELVIVCDPSTDNSNAEVEKFSDSRIKVLYRNEPGPGGYAARNLGIQESSGEWIAFLDADDEYLDNHLECVRDVIFSNPEAKFISSARISSSNGIAKADPFSRHLAYNKVTRISVSEYLFNCVKKKRAVGTNSVVFNKKFFSGQIIFPEGRASRTGDLYAWVVCIVKAKGLVWSPHTASISYRDSVNMVSRNSVPSIELNNDMVNELEELVSEEELLLLKAYANRLMFIAWREHKKSNFDVGNLFKSLYWKSDFLFCCKAGLTSILPDSLLAHFKFMKS